MAKKVETVSLIDTFSEFKELKNIDRTTMVSVLEESFRSVIAKMFGTDENYDVIVNPDKGDFEIWRNREVVADEDLENPNLQIALSEAQKIDASYEVGEEVTDEVIFANFGRRAILNLRQTLASKILELEKDSIYNKYIDKVGTIINAEVYQIWKKEMLLLDDEGNELLLPKTEQIPSDFYRKGETARAVVARVDNKNAEYQKPIHDDGGGDPYYQILGYKNGSFLKVRNISLGYTFPQTLVKKWNLSNLKVYVQAKNPGRIFSNIDFLELDASQNLTSTWNRGFTIGLNVGF